MGKIIRILLWGLKCDKQHDIIDLKESLNSGKKQEPEMLTLSI